MNTANIFLHDSLTAFADERVSLRRGYSTTSDDVRELIRRDQDRRQLRRLLLAGAASAKAQPINLDYFNDLRDQVLTTARSQRKV